MAYYGVALINGPHHAIASMLPSAYTFRYSRWHLVSSSAYHYHRV